jgi:hypothetical protein
MELRFEVLSRFIHIGVTSRDLMMTLFLSQNNDHGHPDKQLALEKRSPL